MKKHARSVNSPDIGMASLQSTSVRLASLLQSAVGMHQRGRVAEAESAYREILLAQPLHTDALHLLGLLLVQKGMVEAGAEFIRRSLQLNPKHPEAHSNLGGALLDLQRPAEALASLDRAIALRPDFLLAHNNRGNALLALNRPQDALASYERALRIQPAFALALGNRANALRRLKRLDEALASIDLALALNAGSAAAHCCRAAILLDLHRRVEALSSCERALTLRPDDCESLTLRGATLLLLKRYDEGLASCDKALKGKPGSAMALCNRGIALTLLKRPAEAAACFGQLLEIDPDYPYAAGYRVEALLHCCEWAEYSRVVAAIHGCVEQGRRTILPLPYLAIADSAASQLNCARTFAADKYPSTTRAAVAATAAPRERTRICYVSADFRDHPVSYLLAGVWEQHDRAHFEIFALSLRPRGNSAFAQRVSAAFDRFIDVSTADEPGIARVMKDLQVDIAVDLGGHTEDGRTSLFAQRAAPVQVNFLGYPGTMGAGYFDYIVADEFVIPPQSRDYYSEQVVYLPDCFQPNDDRRRDSGTMFTREAMGLPQSGPVLCSFNSSYKLNPLIFDVWMGLLRAVPDSVLWLLGSNEHVRRNLCAEAGRRGVNPERLVFAGVMPYTEHLSRLRLADLFLDTLPFNAGTTASDALWAGVPVLTCAGEAFASRMAGSLLHAMGLPELVTVSIEDYAAVARELAEDPVRLARLRAKLAGHRTVKPLFNTSRYTRHLESAFATMCERHRSGQSPASFAVTGSP